MNISVVGKGMKVSNGLDAHIRARVGKLQRFYSRLMNLQIKVEKMSLEYRTDVVAHIPGRILKTTQDHKSEDVSIGLAIDKMERQLKKINSKQRHTRILRPDKGQDLLSSFDGEDVE